MKAYSDPLAPLKEQLATLQAEANDLLANSSYANVTGTEQSTLSTLATTTPDETETAYNTAISEITAAIPAFKNAKPSYDAYVEANGIATTLGATAVTAPTTAAEAVTRTHELYVNIDTKVASDYPYNATDLYAGAFTGFTATNKGQHWSDNAETSYLDQWGTGTITATQNITLPAGSYVLKAAGRAAAGEAAKAYMSANGTTVNFANNGDTGYGITKAGLVKYDAADDTYCNNNNGCGWEWRFIPLTLNDETTVTINLTLERTASWGSFCDFTILMSADDLAGSDDYAALNAAIAAAEAKILGFDDTEYAPYNNVDALTKLAEAKAINQNVDNPKAVVTTATSDLTSATWTANDGDVEIIYNGMFATVAEGQNYPKGWTRTNAWGQMQTITGEALETAYYNQPGSLQYGNQGVYTMPLKANTAYQLSFSFRSHENGSNQGVTVSVLNSKEQGMAPALFLANGSTTDWAPAVAYFTTGDAGNYVLTLANGGNTWMTDVSLMPFSVAQIDFIEDDGPWWGADRQYMETVTIERTVKGGFNTVCLPFEVTAAGVASAFGENAKVYTFQDVDQGSNNSQINFNTKADNIIPANTPVLIGDATASTSQTFSAVMFRNRDNYTVTGTNFDFIGTYDGSTAILSGDYFIGNGALYKSAGNTTIKAFRAYLKAKSAGVKATLFIDGLETSIEAIENGQLTMDNEVIYNVAGQRLQKAQRGVNIINGKKVLVK